MEAQGFKHTRALFGSRIEWRNHEREVILLASLVYALVVPSIFFEPSLGLAAFCLLMWITMPWAFLEKVNTFKQRQWLNASQKLFFASGAWFTIVVVLDVSEPLTATFVSSEISFLPFFMGGVVGLVLAMFCAYIVVESVSSVAAPYKSLVLGMASEMGLLLLSVFGIGFYTIFVYELSIHPQPKPYIADPLAASFGIGIVGGVLMIVAMVTGNKNLAKSAIVILTAPVIFAVVAGGLILAGIIH